MSTEKNSIIVIFHKSDRCLIENIFSNNIDRRITKPECTKRWRQLVLQSDLCMKGCGSNNFIKAVTKYFIIKWAYWRNDESPFSIIHAAIVSHKSTRQMGGSWPGHIHPSIKIILLCSTRQKMSEVLLLLVVYICEWEAMCVCTCVYLRVCITSLYIYIYIYIYIYEDRQEYRLVYFLFVCWLVRLLVDWFYVFIMFYTRIGWKVHRFTKIL